MNVGKIPAVVVGVMVAIAIVGATMPIWADTLATEDTFNNAGRFYVTDTIDSDTTITMDYDIDNNVRSWYIDGVQLEYNVIPDGPEYVQTPTVTGSDNVVYRTDGRARGIETSTGASDYTLTVTSESITHGNKVSNAPLFVASTSETNQVMRYGPNSDVYLLGDSKIIACGYTTLNVSEGVNTNAVISFTGSIDDGVNISVYDSTYTFTVSNVTINKQEINGYNDLYKFQSVTFTTTSSDGLTTDCTYSVIVVPDSVTAERSVYMGGPLGALVGIIPLLIVAGLVVGAVAWFVSRKG